VIEIRNERKEDEQGIRQVIVAAGGGNPKDEAADLVELLRERKKALISLVVVRDKTVVAHIMFSQVTIDVAPKDLLAVALAPLMVLPECQRQGIGSMLVRSGLDECRKADYDMAVVLGHPEYYPRFGFARASNYSLGNEYGAEEAFMALELKEGIFETVRGTVQFSPEFKESGC